MGRRVRYFRWCEGEHALRKLCGVLNLSVCSDRVRMVLSTSSSNAYARIWALHRVFQEAFSLKPLYVIEVVHRNFFKLNCDKKIDVILHELAHIPSSASGGLRFHTPAFWRSYNQFRKMLSRVDRALLFEVCRLLSKKPQGLEELQ